MTLTIGAAIRHYRLSIPRPCSKVIGPSQTHHIRHNLRDPMSHSCGICPRNPPQQAAGPESEIAYLARIFVNSLVRASTCRKHVPLYLLSPFHGTTSRRMKPTKTKGLLSKRLLHSKPPSRNNDDAHSGGSEGKGESPSSGTKAPSYGIPPFPLFVRPEVRRVLFLPRGPPQLDPDISMTLPWLQPKSQAEVTKLLAFLEELRKPTDKTLLNLFSLYRDLPGPRLPYLTTEELNLLMHEFMSVQLRDDVAMLRYLSILDDLRSHKIPITENEWTRAMSFVGQRLKRNTPMDLEATIQLWQEMHRHTGVEVSATAYNVLLDVAAKAKEHRVVRFLLDDMARKGVQYDRYTYSTLIVYYGSIKAAGRVAFLFAKLVDSKEVVDTVMLNSLFSACLSCKTYDLALRIFEKMKVDGRVFHKMVAISPEYDPYKSFVSPTSQVAMSRTLGRKLKSIAVRRARRVAESPSIGRPMVYAGPNIITFYMLMAHHARKGHYDEIETRLLEMVDFGINFESYIFVSVMRGFTWHGRKQPEIWTRVRLEDLYEIMMEEIVSRRGRFVRMTRVLFVWTIRAFAKVTRSKSRVIEVYREMEQLWNRGLGDVKPRLFGTRPGPGQEMDEYILKELQAAIGGPLDYVERQLAVAKAAAARYKAIKESKESEAAEFVDLMNSKFDKKLNQKKPLRHSLHILRRSLKDIDGVELDKGRDGEAEVPLVSEEPLSASERQQRIDDLNDIKGWKERFMEVAGKSEEDVPALESESRGISPSILAPPTSSALRPPIVDELDKITKLEEYFPPASKEPLQEEVSSRSGSEPSIEDSLDLLLLVGARVTKESRESILTNSMREMEALPVKHLVGAEKEVELRLVPEASEPQLIETTKRMNAISPVTNTERGAAEPTSLLEKLRLDAGARTLEEERKQEKAQRKKLARLERRMEEKERRERALHEQDLRRVADRMIRERKVWEEIIAADPDKPRELSEEEEWAKEALEEAEYWIRRDAGRLKRMRQRHKRQAQKQKGMQEAMVDYQLRRRRGASQA